MQTSSLRSKPYQQVFLLNDQLSNIKNRIESIEMRNQKKIQKISKKYQKKKNLSKTTNFKNMKTLSAINSPTSSSNNSSSQQRHHPHHYMRPNRFTQGTVPHQSYAKSARIGHKNSSTLLQNELYHKRLLNSAMQIKPDYRKQSEQNDNDNNFEEQIQAIVNSYKMQIKKQRQHNYILEQSFSYCTQEFMQEIVATKLSQIQRKVKRQQKKLINMSHVLQDSKQQRRSSNLIKQTQRRRSQSKKDSNQNEKKRSISVLKNRRDRSIISSAKNKKMIQESKLKEIIQDYQKLIKSKNGQIQNLQIKAKKIAEQSNEKQDNFNKKIQDLETLILNTESQLHMSQSKLRQWISKQKQYKLNISQLQSKIEKFVENQKTLIPRTKSSNMITSQRFRIDQQSKIQSQLKTLKQQLMQKQELISKLKKQSKDKIIQIQMRMQQLSTQNDRMKKTIIQKQNSIFELTKTKGQLQSKLKVSEQMVKQFQELLKGQNLNTSQDMKELLEKSVCRQSQSNQNIQRIQYLQSQIASIQKALMQKEWDSINLIKQNYKLKSQFRQLQEENQNLKKQMDFSINNQFQQNLPCDSMLKFSFGAQQIKTVMKKERSKHQQQEKRYKQEQQPDIVQIQLKNSSSEQIQNQSQFSDRVSKNQRVSIIFEENMKLLQQQNGNLKQKISETNIQFANLKAKLILIQTQNIQIKSDRDYLKKQIEQLNQTLSLKKQQLNDSNDNLKDLKNKLSENISQKMRLIEENKGYRLKVQEFQKLLQNEKQQNIDNNRSILNQSNFSQSNYLNSLQTVETSERANLVENNKFKQLEAQVIDNKYKIQELEGTLKLTQQLNQKTIETYKRNAEKLIIQINTKQKEANQYLKKYQDAFKQLCSLKQSIFDHQDSEHKKSQDTMMKDLLQQNQNLTKEVNKKLKQEQQKQQLISNLYQMLSKRESQIALLSEKLSNTTFQLDKQKIGSRQTKFFKKVSSPRAEDLSLDHFANRNEQNLLSDSMISDNTEKEQNVGGSRTKIKQLKLQVNDSLMNYSESYMDNMSVLYGKQQLMSQTAAQYKQGRKDWKKLFENTAKYVKGLKQTIKKQNSKILGLQKLIEVIKKSQHFKQDYIHHLTTEVNENEKVQIQPDYLVKDYESQKLEGQSKGKRVTRQAKHWRQKYHQICHQLKLVMQENQMMVNQVTLMESEILKNEENQNNLINVKNLYKNQVFAQEKRFAKESQHYKSEIKKLKQQLDIKQIQYQESQLYKFWSKVHEQYQILIQLCQNLFWSTKKITEEQKDQFIDKRQIFQENLEFLKKSMLKN